MRNVLLWSLLTLALLLGAMLAAVEARYYGLHQARPTLRVYVWLTIAVTAALAAGLTFAMAYDAA